MVDIKDQKEIRVLAKYLRRAMGNRQYLEFAIKELFKGKAEVSSDNQGQLVIYTGHSFGMHTGDVTCMETKEFLDS